MALNTPTEEDSLRHCTAPGIGEIELLATRQLSEQLVVDHLFEPGKLNLAYTNLDRLTIGGVCPSGERELPCPRLFGAEYFTQRRELGVLNLGNAGVVSVGGRGYELGRLDCLYIGIEEPEITFGPSGDGMPVFYLASCPAHKKYPTTLIRLNEAESVRLGDESHASSRTLHKFICPGGVDSCQLSMGFTELDANSVWNTMPVHLHSRRSEIYLYFDLDDRMVFHIYGTPDATRHLVVRDRQAVLSPDWSIHSGVGTGCYRFAWVMAGENRDFSDIDPVPSALLS